MSGRRGAVSIWPVAFCGGAELAVVMEDMWGGAERSSEHMLHSAGPRRAFAMCGLSSAVCLTSRERHSLQTRGQQPAGDRSLTHTHTYTHICTENKEKLSLLLAGLSEEKSWACREDSYQLIVLPHLSVAPKAAY